VVKSESNHRCMKCIVCCSIEVVIHTPSGHCECVKYALRLLIRIAPAVFNYHHAELNNFIIIITIIIHNIVFDNLNVSIVIGTAGQCKIHKGYLLHSSEISILSIFNPFNPCIHINFRNVVYIYRLQPDDILSKSSIVM